MKQRKKILSHPVAKKNASKLHQKIFEQCKRRFPLYTILQEQTIYIDDRGVSEHLFVDILVKELKIAIECNGIQHFKNNNFFYSSKFEFEKALKRDILKEEYLRKNGYYFISFGYDEKITDEYFDKKINTILSGE